MTKSDIARIAVQPLKTEQELQMVEIIVLNWKRPDLESRCAEHIIKYTRWPYKLTMYDNRWNSQNTAKIWNKLALSSVCPFVCILDSDAFVPSLGGRCWLTRMMETFRIPGCRLVVPLGRCATPAQLQNPAPYPAFERISGEWSGFCFLFRPELLNHPDCGGIGAFDEEFCGYGQDTEFASRLFHSGGGAYLRRDVYVEHLRGGSFLTATGSGEYDAEADREYAQDLFLRKTGKSVPANARPAAQSDARDAKD